jgi:hypothetical protein
MPADEKRSSIVAPAHVETRRELPLPRHLPSGRSADPSCRVKPPRGPGSGGAARNRLRAGDGKSGRCC